MAVLQSATAVVTEELWPAVHCFASEVTCDSLKGQSFVGKVRVFEDVLG